MKNKRLFSFITVIIMLFSVCTALPVKISLPLETSASGIDNIAARADYLYNITWTAQTTVKGWRNNYTFTQGNTYHIPYGQPVSSGKYVYWGISIDNFLASAQDASGVFYTKRSVNNYNEGSYSTYYAMDCSALASYCWGLSNRTTTSSWSSLPVTSYGKCTSANVNKIQIGDALNLAGTHIVIVSDVTYDSSGNVTQVEITEQTPPEIKRSYYTASSLISKYSSYTIYRYNKRDSVTPPPNVPNPNPPTYSNLTADKTIIAVGEEITFTASSDYATGFSIGVDNKNGRYVTQEMANGQLTLTFNETGSYGAYVTSYNSAGYVDSNWISFIVYDTTPRSSELLANKYVAKVGEEITFTASSDLASAYWIGIDNKSGRYLTQEMPNGQLTLTFNEAGSYGAYVTSLNSLGYVDSQWINFTIYDSAPTYSILEADKVKVAVGEEITFTASSDFASAYWIGIDNEIERYTTQEMHNGNLTLTFDKAGNYGAYVTSLNTFGYVDSKWIDFTVYDKSPTYGKLESEWRQYKFVVGDIIPLVATSDLATGYWLGFDKGSERIITEEMQNGRHSVVVTEAGEYSAYVSVSNKYGGIDSDRIYFLVYDKAPTFGTLEIIDKKTTYFVGDTIRFKANSDYASEYWIGIDKEKERIITDSMQDAVYELTLTEAGEYSAYVSVSNGLGGLDSKSVYFKVYNTSEIQGDINNDHKLNVADAVLLQKWLLGVPNTELANWEAADLFKDGIIDVFDMVEMRKLLIESR